MTIRIAVLGDIGVERDGSGIALPTSGKATALLVWLALNPGEHARARLAPLLWPDVLDESARGSLRTAVWALRNALGPGSLVTTRTTLGLAPDAAVDVLELRRLIAAGRTEEAGELAQAELAPGIEEEWLDVSREEHRVMLDELYEQVAAEAEAAGDHAGAVVWARRRVWLDPVSEEAQQALLRRLAAVGDRAGALHSFTRFRTRLRADLGLAPSPESVRLVEAIRSAETGASELPARLAAAAGEAMVGREEELDRLSARFEQARAERLPVVVAVSADSGVGKTRLIAELARRVQTTGHRAVYGAAGPDALLPYQPFVEALSEGAGLSFDEIVGNADEDPTGARRYRFFEHVARLVGDLTPPAPALVALDDLHWADVSTMQLIRHLARSHHAGGVLVVLSYRAGDVSAPLADLLMDLNRELPLERIVLRGLTEHEIASLLREWGSDAPDHEAEALHDRTDGNPFFVRELVRDRAEGRDPRQSVPQTVRDVVALRLARLDPAAREVLAAGAVAGPAFDPADANAVLAEPSSDAELVSLVDLLVGSGLVDDSERGPLLRFEHSLMRDAVYGELGAARRAALHRALADRLIRRHGSAGGPHLAEIAHHLRAGGSGRAAEWTISAADYAFGAVAFDQAARLYGLALAALPPGDDSRRRLVNRRAMASQLLFHAAVDAR